jgi:hypothetical protein
VQLDEEIIKKEIYENLRVLGLDINTLKSLNLSLYELEDFYRRIVSLVGSRKDWYGEAN